MSSQEQQVASVDTPNPIVKSGKLDAIAITIETIQLLESAGSTESAKIARDYLEAPQT